MILLFTGSGKGKTTAAIGQIIRAHGRGLKCAFGQFMKDENQSGECQILSKLLGKQYVYAKSAGFYYGGDKSEHINAALCVLSWAWEIFPKVHLLVLDEAVFCLREGIIKVEDLYYFLGKTKAKQKKHLVLTGRGGEYFRDEYRPDYITECLQIAHPYGSGQEKINGIEF